VQTGDGRRESGGVCVCAYRVTSNSGRHNWIDEEDLLLLELIMLSVRTPAAGGWKERKRRRWVMRKPSERSVDW